MNVTERELCQITQDVCDTMLDLALSPLGEKPKPASSLVASVYITGARNAVVYVTVCDSAAESIAETMFDCPNPPRELVVDAVSEVVNMIGGNVKGMFGAECELSLPCIEGTYDEHDDDVSIAFQLDDGEIYVCLKHTTPVEAVN